MIISLYLSTEIYHQLPPPRGFDEVPLVRPTLSQLMGSLCLSHFQGTGFKISYQTLQIDNNVFNYLVLYTCPLLLFPLCLSENDNVLILAWNLNKQPIIYKFRENRVEKTRFTNEIRWFLIKDYVESLVSTSCIEKVSFFEMIYLFEKLGFN